MSSGSGLQLVKFTKISLNKKEVLSLFSTLVCVGELAVSLNRMSSPPDSPLAAPLQTLQSFIDGMIWSLAKMMKNIEKCFEDPQKE